MRLAPLPRAALCALALASACAVVDSLQSGVRSLTRWAGGIARGEGRVEDGEQEGQWTFYADDGSVRARGAYEDDKQVGPWVYFFPNGDKEFEGQFRDNRREGRWRYWHPGGAPRAQGWFVAGREQGPWMFWNEQGQLVQRGPFLVGLQEGRWRYAHDDGTKKAEGLFWKGEKVGRWEFWTPSGERSAHDHDMPAGLEAVEERWPDGHSRRTGFLSNGEKEGLWFSYHRNGQPRLSGPFENGRGTGRWFAYRGNGEVLASGPVDGSRPSGSWMLWTANGETAWSAGGARPAEPLVGEWSKASLAEEQGLEAVLTTWLAEIAEPVTDDAKLRFDEGAEAEVDASRLAEVDVEPDVPVQAQPWTAREQREYQEYVDAYTSRATPGSSLSSRYGGGGGQWTDGAQAGASDPDKGSPSRADEYVGKPLALTMFKSENGDAFDLGDLKGHRVVLVVLRGFSGGLCVYCTAQTEALYESGALERFEQLNAKLEVVFPGGQNGLEAFKQGYATLGKGVPPYGLLYERDIVVGRLLDIEGSKVIPSTFILDEDGIVRFAYIGKDIADRPPVDLLIEELEKLESKR